MRIPVTTLQSYNDYLQDDITLEQLKQKITAPVASKYMYYGKAFHDIVENYHDRYDPENGIYVAKEYPDVFLSSRDGELAGSYTFPSNYIPYGDSAREAKNVIMVRTPTDEIELVGKADLLYGNTAIELKTTYSYINYNKYRNSIQWKYYTWLFDVSRVIYVIVLIEVDEDKATHGGKKQLRIVGTPETMEFLRGGDDIQECKETLESFVDFVNKHNLRGFFPKKGMVEYE